MTRWPNRPALRAGLRRVVHPRPFASSHPERAVRAPCRPGGPCHRPGFRPPSACPRWRTSICREPDAGGWQAARSLPGLRTRDANATAVKHWLEPALGWAWLNGTAFEDVQVTPAYLEASGGGFPCPVTRGR